MYTVVNKCVAALGKTTAEFFYYLWFAISVWLKSAHWDVYLKIVEYCNLLHCHMPQCLSPFILAVMQYLISPPDGENAA